MKAHSTAPLPLVVCVLTLSIFLIDLMFPLGVASGVPYIAVVLLAMWMGGPRPIYVTAVVASVLTVAGFFIPVPEGPGIIMGIENRLIALFAIWVTAVLASTLVARNEIVRQQRDFNEKLIDAARSSILLTDPDGAIVRINEFTAELTGHDLSQAAGRSWLDVLLPEPERSRGEAFHAACVEGRNSEPQLLPVVTRSGIVRHLSWASRVITDDSGKPIGVLYVGLDVTPLLEAQQKLLQSERLAAIGQALAALSHEARNELSTLRLALDLLEAQGGGNKSSQLARHLRGATTRLSRLLDDVRGYAAPILLERSTCQLAGIWRKVWQEVEGRHAGEHQLVEQGDVESVRCHVDPLRIEQVFRNVFENALGACITAGVVTIRCTVEDVEGSAFARISIRDNGPGLPPGVKEKIFEPFFTTKVQGTGLGMPICRRIIDAHGGELIIGDPAEGAEFIILLPGSEPTSPRVNEPAAMMTS